MKTNTGTMKAEAPNAHVGSSNAGASALGSPATRVPKAGSPAARPSAVASPAARWRSLLRDRVIGPPPANPPSCPPRPTPPRLLPFKPRPTPWRLPPGAPRAPPASELIWSSRPTCSPPPRRDRRGLSQNLLPAPSCKPVAAFGSARPPLLAGSYRDPGAREMGKW